MFAYENIYKQTKHQRTYVSETNQNHLRVSPSRGLYEKPIDSGLHDLSTHGSSGVPLPSDKVSNLKSLRETMEIRTYSFTHA